jgi:dihydrofolate reductase
MIVTLHMAVSIDGFIAKPDGNSDWVSLADEILFLKRCVDAGCLALGRKTFDQYKGKIYPVALADNIVISRDIQKDEGAVFFVTSPRAALAKAESLGHDKLLLAGGGRISAAFLDENLIDEIFLSVHPLVLGKGIRLFDGAKIDAHLSLCDVSAIDDGLAQLRYRKNQ